MRISDVWNMKTSLELFHLNSWKYPLPDEWNEVSYGWDLLWTQWKFWESVVKNLSRNLSEVPKDPLTNRMYLYSTTNAKNEYQILSLMENDDFTLNEIMNKTNAEDLKVTTKVDWIYNWVFVKTPNYIVPTPSLINAEVISSNITLNTTNIKSQITNKWWNIPTNLWNVLSKTWALNINFSVYNWSVDKDISNSEKQLVMQAIQNTYTGSELVNDDKIKYVLENTNAEELVNVFDVIILNKPNNLKSSSNSESWLEWWQQAEESSLCMENSKPVADNIVSYIWNPIYPTPYLKGAANCWYTCKDWFFWPFCDHPISSVDISSCSEKWEIINSTTTYPWCDSVDKIICTWNWKGYTIASCNIWASVAWRIDNINPNTNTNTIWQYFQWWRNKWFDFDFWNTNFSTEAIDWSIWLNPDIDTYPFIWAENFTWSTTNIFNNWINDYNLMNWPCATWYYIPSIYDWEWVLYSWNYNNNINNFLNDFNISLAWMMGLDTTNNTITYGGLNNSSYFATSTENPLSLNKYMWEIITTYRYAPAQWLQIRCFKK